MHIGDLYRGVVLKLSPKLEDEHIHAFPVEEIVYSPDSFEGFGAVHQMILMITKHLKYFSFLYC